MLSPDFLHFCTHRNSGPTYTNVRIARLPLSLNRTTIKVFGSKIGWVREIVHDADLYFAVCCELLSPQNLSCNACPTLSAPLRTALPRPADASFRNSPSFCPIFDVFADVNSNIFEHRDGAKSIQPTSLSPRCETRIHASSKKSPFAWCWGAYGNRKNIFDDEVRLCVRRETAWSESVNTTLPHGSSTCRTNS